jgi:hypothetical protein
MSTPAEWTVTSVALATNITTISTGRAVLRGCVVTSVLSAHDVVIEDGAGGSVVAGIEASAAHGTTKDFHDMTLPNGLAVNPHDSGTGTIALVWKADHEGLAGSGYTPVSVRGAGV